MKYLYIELRIIDGNREYTQRSLHSTTAKNILFAAERFAATYWGYGEREGEGWLFDGGEVYVEYTKVKELTKEEYENLNRLFY